MKDKKEAQLESIDVKKKYRPVWLITAGTIITVILIAFLVHWLSPMIPSLITADGMLSYIISCISSVATILLAAVAYLQTDQANYMADKLAEQANELSRQSNNAANIANSLAEKSFQVEKQANELALQANEMSQKMVEIEKIRFEMEVRPFVLITNWTLRKCNFSEILNAGEDVYYQIGQCDKDKDIFVLVLELTNTTQSYEMVQYHSATVFGGTNDTTPRTWAKSVVERNSFLLMLHGSETKRMGFYADKSYFDRMQGSKIQMDFILENRFDDKYREKVDIYVVYSNCDEKVGCILAPQNYNIETC